MLEYFECPECGAVALGNQNICPECGCDLDDAEG